MRIFESEIGKTNLSDHVKLIIHLELRDCAENLTQVVLQMM